MKRMSVAKANRMVDRIPSAAALPRHEKGERHPLGLPDRYLFRSKRGHWRRKDLTTTTDEQRIAGMVRWMLWVRRSRGVWPTSYLWRGRPKDRLFKRAVRRAKREFAADPWTVAAE